MNEEITTLEKNGGMNEEAMTRGMNVEEKII